MKKRQSGVLMHISSLPGQYGIGSFGQSAYDFVDFLVRTKQRYWQILPLGTTSYGDSPYQSFSAFAGNTHFIDFDLLIEQGLLTEADLKGVDFGQDPTHVDYAKVFEQRRPLLEKAVANFLKSSDQKEFQEFCEANASWLELFAEYMAIKEHFDLKAWTEWPDAAIRAREPKALAKYREELADKLTYHRVTQFFFFQQWLALKAYANDHWSESNRNLYAMWPRLSTTVIENNVRTSSWFMRNGAFLRLKTLEVGYTLPESWTKKAYISSARVYCSGNNLLLLSGFKLWDIEMGGSGLGYPIQRVINLGVQINF